LGFADRLTQTNTFIDLADELVWSDPEISRRLVVVPFGYETHIPEETRAKLRYLHSTTARHIKFAPDFFLVDSRNPDLLYLFEYKCTQTPIYSASQIRLINSSAGRTDLGWQDIGQREEEAYDNYFALAQQLGIKVAVFNYCAYHERLLLLDFIENIKIAFRGKVTSATVTGSRTPFINFDAHSMRTFEEFVSQVHGLPTETLERLGASLRQKLAETLPILHHRSSPLYKKVE
jgi:hypothetical protein